MKSGNLAVLLAAASCFALASCASTSVPSQNVPVAELPAPSEPGQWEKYGAEQTPRVSEGEWKSSTAWGHPPRHRDVVRTSIPAPSKPEAAPAASVAVDHSLESVSDETPDAPSTEVKMESPAKPAGKKVVSAWADNKVAEAFRGNFDDAVAEAARKGSARVVEEETSNVYAFSNPVRSGKCTRVEVTVLSPEGTLPIISRGHATVCS